MRMVHIRIIDFCHHKDAFVMIDYVVKRRPFQTFRAGHIVCSDLRVLYDDDKRNILRNERRMVDQQK